MNSRTDQTDRVLHLQEVGQHQLAVFGQDRFGVELDALDRQFFVTQAHYQAVGRFGRDLKGIGKRVAFYHKRVIAAGVEIAVDPRKKRSAVVFDDDRLAVDGRGPADDTAAEMLADGLVAETDAEDRHPPRKAVDHGQGDAGPVGRTRAGRDKDPFGAQAVLDLVDSYRVVPEDLHLGTQFTQVLDEVIGERVVIIDDEQHKKTETAKKGRYSRSLFT